MTEAAIIPLHPEAPPKRQRTRIRIEIADPGRFDDVVELLRSHDHHNVANALTPQKMYPFWYIATIQREVKGCLSFLPGQPMVLAEFMCVDKGLDPMVRARIVKKLEAQVYATATAMGASIVSMFIPFDNKTWKKQVKRRGYSAQNQGNLMVRYLGGPDG